MGEDGVGGGQQLSCEDEDEDEDEDVDGFGGGWDGERWWGGGVVGLCHCWGLER